LHPPVPAKATHFGFPQEPAGAGAGVGVVVGAGAGAGDGAGAGAGVWSELGVGESVVLGASRRDVVVSLDVVPPPLPLLLRTGPSGPAEQAAVTSVVARSNKTRTFTS
jgi:hypothetical protein